jgi:hypothetical protein
MPIPFKRYCTAQLNGIGYRKRVSHADSEKSNNEQRKIVIGGSRDQTMCERVVCSHPPLSPDLIAGCQGTPLLPAAAGSPPPPAVSNYCTFSEAAKDLCDSLRKEVKSRKTNIGQFK